MSTATGSADDLRRDQLPHLFSEYERLGVECLLLSAYPVDSIFEVKARAYAAINAYWIAMSLPAQTHHLMPSGLITPAGTYAALVAGQPTWSSPTSTATTHPSQVPLHLARPWRTTALKGDIYRTRPSNRPPKHQPHHGLTARAAAEVGD